MGLAYAIRADQGARNYQEDAAGATPFAGGLAAVLADGTGTVRCTFPDPIRGNPANRSRGLTIAGEGPAAQLRGFGHGQSPRTFGHDGAGGQIAWADPDSGLSFSYLTNGLDADVIREARRKIGVATRAAACAP